MAAGEGAGRRECHTPLPQEPNAYIGLTPEDVARIGLTPEDVARLVRLLLMESLQRQLASFRSENLAAQPVKGQEEFLVTKGDAVPVGDGARWIGEEMVGVEFVLRMLAGQRRGSFPQVLPAEPDFYTPILAVRRDQTDGMTSYISPAYFLIQRREAGAQVIKNSRAMGILPGGTCKPQVPPFVLGRLNRQDKNLYTV